MSRSFTLVLAASLLSACAAPLPDEAQGEEPALATTDQALGATDTVPRSASPSSIVYRAETVIDATPEEIWDVLVDLPAYAEWNPWVYAASGDMREGGHVEVDVKLGALSMHAKHVVLRGRYPTTFCWRDDGFTTLFVYGQRCRYLTPQADGTTRFRQEVLIEGPMAQLFAKVSGYTLQDGIDAETPALKQRVEALDE